MRLELFDNIIKREGWQSKLYTDIYGIPHIGFGFRISALSSHDWNIWSADLIARGYKDMNMKNLKEKVIQESIEGCGMNPGHIRSLDDIKGIKDKFNFGTLDMSLKAGISIFVVKLITFQSQVLQALPWLKERTEVLRDALTDMAYQMGVGVRGKSGLLSFVNTLEYIRTFQKDKAVKNLFKSDWANMTNNRGVNIGHKFASDVAGAIKYDIDNKGKDPNPTKSLG